MKLAMYKGSGTLFDKIIRIATLSKYSHCELVIDGLCYSSSVRDNGVRMKYITLDDNWEVYDLPNTYDQVYAITVFTKNVGKKYDWLGAITQVLPFQINLPNSFFCSEICCDMLNIPKSKKYTPIKLLNKVI